jgi:uncharacterized membrane protein YkoI
MRNLIDRLFKRRQPTLKSALTPEQACTIAEQAVAGSEWAGLMTLATLMVQDERLVWAIGTATRGAGMSVMIDDSTGRVIRCEQIHGR